MLFNKKIYAPLSARNNYIYAPPQNFIVKNFNNLIKEFVIRVTAIQWSGAICWIF